MRTVLISLLIAFGPACRRIATAPATCGVAMKEKELSRGIIGRAFDSVRIDFMEVNDFLINLYLIHHYGDPALRQFGNVVGY
jgi:hypothetical protein